MIATARGARRFARAIVGDLTRYYEDKVAGGLDMTEEVAQGTALFRSRVLPEHASVWEDELRKSRLRFNSRP